jgi:hypothetical protein
MTPQADFQGSNPFESHACLADDINDGIVQSGFDDGVRLDALQRWTILRIQTQSRVYTMMFCGDNDALIWGHPELCPDPVKVRIQGSTWGGSMLKQSFIGRAMSLEYEHPARGRVTTSPILKIDKL